MTNVGRRAADLAVGLVGACHPVPTLAVTAMTAVLTRVVDNSWSTTALATLAVLTGQLSIGWSNDALDAERDTAVGREDKPVASGAVSVTGVWAAAWVALGMTTGLSLSLGWRAGLVHLIGMVGGGWLYNLRLKSSALSPLPFLIAFGGLPAVATLALPTHPWPPGWVLASGALLGLAAHFANVLPDLDQDRATGIVGLPHRLGRVRSITVAISGALLAALIVVVATGDARSAVTAVLTAAALACAAMGLLLVRRNPHSEAAFFATMAIAAIAVALLANSHAIV